MKRAKNCLSAVIVALVLVACGSEQDARETETGAVAVSAKWPETEARSARTARAAEDLPREVVTVRVIIKGPGMSDVQQDFVASLGKGTVNGVPAGQNRTATLQGLDAAKQKTWEGQTEKGVTVYAGRTTHAGMVAMAPVDPGENHGQPTGVIATHGNRHITLTWNAVEGAVSYNVYWSNTSGAGTTGTLVLGIADTTFTLGNLTDGTEYFFVVTADSAGGESLPSSEAAAVSGIPVAGLSFTDSSLAACVQATGVTYVSELTHLDCSDRGITDLTGTERLTSLTFLGLWDNQISDVSALAGLTNLTEQLDLGGNQISDVSALADLTNLTELILWGNQISDVSALAGLTKLTQLDLESNQISDVSPLADLTNLTKLFLWSNQISDASALAGLTSLTWLDLESNQISTGVADLSALINVVWLDLSANEFGGTPTIPCGALLNLDTFLDGGDGGFAGAVTWDVCAPRLTAPTGFTATPGNQQITLGWNPVQGAASYNVYWSDTSGAGTAGTLVPGIAGSTFVHDGLTDGTEYFYVVTAVGPGGGESSPSSQAAAVSGISVASLTFADPNLGACVSAAGATYVSQFEFLFCPSSGVTTLDGVDGLTNLTDLDLWSNQISEVGALAGLTSLTWLDLGDNQISDVGPLADLTNLTGVNLWSNQISDVSALVGLTSLTWLDLGDNQISDVGPLADLTNLTNLDLGGSQISDVGPLADLTNLTELFLWSNQISDVSALAGLTSLTWLHLGGNQISDVSTLAGLTSLTWLVLESNQISDVGPLADLTNLTELFLESNQINDVSPLAGLTNVEALDLRYNQISTGVADLSALINVVWLDLWGNEFGGTSTIPCSDLATLDTALDGGDGGFAGAVVWDVCMP